ncbi:ribonuclease H-like domain-containing protein [Tanacetum coccineum]
MEAGTNSTTLTAKLHILNPGDYDLWLMRIEQYEYEPTTAEEKQSKRNEMKARETLLMSLPNRDQLKFHSYKNAKLLMEVIEKSNHASRVSDAVICAFLATQSNSSQLAQEDLEQIDPDDLEEIDLQWEMAMLTIRARRFIKRTGRKLDVNGQRVRFDRTKVECYNCHKYGHFARECKAPKNQENRGREINRRTMTVETPTENALVARDGIRSSSSLDSEVDSCSKSCVNAYATLKEQYDSLSSDYKRSQFNLVSYKAVKFKTGLGYNAASSTAATPAVESFVNSFEMLVNQEYKKSKSDKGYHAVPPPFIGNFITYKAGGGGGGGAELTFMDEIVENENMDVTTVKTVESNLESAGVKSNGDAVEPKTVRKNSFRPPVIQYWNSDDESGVEIIPRDKIVSSSTKKIKFVKTKQGKQK